MLSGLYTSAPEVLDSPLTTHAMLAQVALFNLRQWRCDGLADKTARIADENAHVQLYNELGSQPLLSLVVGQRFEALHWRWNVDGLGWSSQSRCWPSDSAILHWSGGGKPWGLSPTCDSLFTFDFEHVPVVSAPVTNPRPGLSVTAAGMACRAFVRPLPPPRAPRRFLRRQPGKHLLPRSRPD